MFQIQNLASLRHTLLTLSQVLLLLIVDDIEQKNPNENIFCKIKFSCVLYIPYLNLFSKLLWQYKYQTYRPEITVAYLNVHQIQNNLFASQIFSLLLMCFAKRFATSPYHGQ